MTRRAGFFEHAADMLFLTGPDGRIVDANPAAEAGLGYSHTELTSLTIPALCTPAQFDKALDLVNSEAAVAELDVVARDGRLIPLEVSYRRDGGEGYVVARDVAQRKLAAMGLLAGGVAHDFNNLLAGILGHAAMLSDIPSPEVREEAGIIIRAAGRAKELTDRLLGFAARGSAQKTAVDLHAAVREVVALLRGATPENIVLQTALDAPRAVILADAGQIHQVLLNLAVNARDAMPKGGALTFRTQGADQAVRLSIEDSGVGIPPEVRHRIFEPYFTTKKRDRGTGLGLSVVYGIVHEHRGSIELVSEVGKGTTFSLTFPLVAA